MIPASSTYRGRIAPTPSGYLHLGHARTFWIAQERAKSCCGSLVLRNEDLDRPRCKPEFLKAMFKDLAWIGLEWQEGPDLEGPFGPYNQSERNDFYVKTWALLRDSGSIYPSPHSRKDVNEALTAPHEGDRESIFPTALRPPSGGNLDYAGPGSMNWRFRVPDGAKIEFDDGCTGPQSFVAGRDFGDFVVWRKAGGPSYEMAVVADDHSMKISEVVRGEDLLLSTARQILIYEALRWKHPAFYHCPLVRDENGRRLAKRHDSLSLRSLRKSGCKPEDIHREWRKLDLS